MSDLVTLARADGPYGEVVLRRRGVGDRASEELIVNGAFAMDSAETSSELALAALASPYAGGRVLLGGLGLGYSARAVLASDVARLDVVEIEPALVEWARAGITPTLAAVAADPRVRLLVDDVALVLAREPDEPWDAILLDVDNGPDFLIHPANAPLYQTTGIELALGRLRPGGLLAVWCQGPHAGLLATLSAAVPTAAEHRFRVERGERHWDCAIYTARRPDPG